MLNDMVKRLEFDSPAPSAASDSGMYELQLISSLIRPQAKTRTVLGQVHKRGVTGGQPQVDKIGDNFHFSLSTFSPKKLNPILLLLPKKIIIPFIIARLSDFRQKFQFTREYRYGSLSRGSVSDPIYVSKILGHSHR